MTTTAPVLAPLPGISTSIGTANRGGGGAVDRPGLAGTGQASQTAQIPSSTGTGTVPGIGTGAPGTVGPSSGDEAPPLRPGRPLIGGGPFTLGVALGLAADQSREQAATGNAGTPGTQGEGATGSGGSAGEGSGGGGLNELTEEEEQVVRELQARDREVRAHEAAHAAAGGAYAGAPTYTYQRGPDGRQYAVGGSVSIDTSPVQGDPAATIQKAQQIKRAALAPAEPSAQDRAVAAAADALLLQAQADLREERRAEAQGEGGAIGGPAGIVAGGIAQGGNAPGGNGLGGNGVGGLGPTPPPQIISITV